MSINQSDPLIPTTSWVRELYNDLNNRIVNSGGSQSLAQVLGVAADANSVPITGLVSLAAATTLDLKIGATTVAQITSAGLLVDSITELTAAAGVTVSGTSGDALMVKTTAYANGLLRAHNGGVQIGDFNSDVNSTLINVDDSSLSITLGAVAGIVLTSTHIRIPLTAYANDAAAVIGGLITGDLYQVTGTGIVQIVQ